MPRARAGAGTFRQNTSGTWVSQTRDPQTGKQKTRTWSGLTKKAAQKAHAEWVAQVQARTDTDTRATVARHMDEWLATKRGTVSDNTYLGARRDIARIVARIGNMRLADVDIRTVQAVLADLRARYSPSTVTNTKGRWSEAMTAAVNWRLIPFNPVAQVRGTRTPRPSEDPKVPTTAELDAILAAEQRPMWLAFWTLHRATGARTGETIALHWRDIDLERATITIARTVTFDADGRQVVGEHTKTKLDRKVTVDPDDLAPLRAWRAELAGKNLLLVAPGQPCWPSPRHVGRPLNAQTVSNAWRKALAAAGVKEPRKLGGLRHWHASTLAASGVPPMLGAPRMGHSVPMFSALYGRHAPADELEQLHRRIPRPKAGER